MAIDPMAIDRPSDDAGFRDLADRIDGLESRLSELSATLGGGNIFMTKGTLHVSGSAIFDGSLTIANGLIGSEALKEQVSVSETHGYTESWRPGSSWDSAVHVGVTKPDWATKAVVLVGGSISPDYDVNSGSPYAYGRVVCNGETSPSVMSLLGSVSVPAAIMWPFFLPSVPRTFLIGTQAFVASGRATGGSAYVSGVCIWMR